MTNIEETTNPSNGVFKDLSRSVINSTAFRAFINRLRPNKLRDSSFTGMIKTLDAIDSSILTSSNFINALSDLHEKDDDIITNGAFSDAIQVMRPDFLKSREFGEFLNRLDPNLLERRDSGFSFSGQLKPEYITVLASSIDRTVLEDSNFTSFINSIDLDNFQDGSFSSFITSVDEFLLQDEDFTDPLAALPDEVLTNGKFTDDVQGFSILTLSNDAFGETLAKYSSFNLAQRGSGYTPLEEEPFVVLNPN